MLLFSEVGWAKEMLARLPTERDAATTSLLETIAAETSFRISVIRLRISTTSSAMIYSSFTETFIKNVVYSNKQ